MNPSCPFNPAHVLRLRTFSVPPEEERGRILWTRERHYVCDRCKKHWPRGAVISRETARDEDRPKGARGRGK